VAPPDDPARVQRFLDDLKELKELLETNYETARPLGVAEKQVRDWLTRKHRPTKATLDRHEPRLTEALARARGDARPATTAPRSEIAQERRPVTHAAGKFQKLLNGVVQALEEDDARTIYFALNRVLEEHYGRGFQSRRENHGPP
jgi:hypothetical protein